MTADCEILIGDVRDKLREMRDRGTKVHCVVTSPPYWGLRDYGTAPQIWGGRDDCAHEWRSSEPRHRGGPQGSTGDRANRDTAANDTAANDTAGNVATGCFCAHCNAWLGELGLEPTPELFCQHVVEVFRLLRDVLRDDGTLWLNIGDCYATGAGRVGDSPGGGAQGEKWKSGYKGDRTGHEGKHTYRQAMGPMTQPNRLPIPGLKPKDLVGQPWMVAFALRADGWWLRSDTIWHKPNPMPESTRDRPTKSHEYIFLLTKAPRYFYDGEAIKEPVTGGAKPRGQGNNRKVFPAGWASGPGSHSAIDHSRGPRGAKDDGRVEQGLRDSSKFGRGAGWRVKQNESFSSAITHTVAMRNARSVWSFPTEPYPEAHYATFPTSLPRRCLLAGTSAVGCCPECEAPWVRVMEGKPRVTTGWRQTCRCAPAAPVPCTVMDPFGGSGTTGQVATSLGRHAIMIDLDPANEPRMRARLIRKLLVRPKRAFRAADGQRDLHLLSA